MAILRKRRGRGLSPAEAPAPALERPSTPRLEERLQEIAAAAAAPEEALEPALQLILEASGAHAGALCLFDRRHGLMRLAAEVGLSEEGCARLRSVRRGDPTAWDMPLHGLLNRRAYLIESAPRNRYVPRLIDPSTSVRSVACVPLYGAATPLGSVILITLAPRSLAERDIHALERPLRELARMIEAARRRGGAADEPVPPLRAFLPAAGPSADMAVILAERDRLRTEVAERITEHTSLTAELAARAGENEHLRTALGTATAERHRLTADLERIRREAERAGSLGTSLAAAERERARLASVLETAAAERVQQTQATIALEQARAAAERAAESALADLEVTRRTLGTSAAAATARATELAAVVERLQARLVEIEALATAERQRVHDQEREQQRLTHELHEAAAREQRLRAEARAAAERETSSAPEELRRALAAVETAEEARTTALAGAEEAAAALERTQAIVRTLEDEATRARGEIERLTAAERLARTTGERVAEELAGLRASEQQALERAAHLERELHALRDERGRLTAVGREHEAQAATRTAHLETLAAERDQARDALRTIEAERDRLLSEQMATAAARTSLEDALARETAERARVAAALETVQGKLSTLEGAHARNDIEAARHAADVQRLANEREELIAERDQLLAERSRVLVIDGEAEALAESPVRVVTVAATGGGRARPREAGAEERVIAVIDVGCTWEGARTGGPRVTVLAPGLDIAARLRSEPAARVLVNLAAPGALESVVALRPAGSGVRVWACIAVPGADRALPLGMIEPVTRPLDPDAILNLLAGYAVRGTRVVTAGPDVDGLMSLRQALARQGMSVSMAWDAKQAADLMGVVRPEVVVVDLALTRREGYGIVASLALGDPLPNAVLVPGEDDAAAAFAATLADPTRLGQAVALADVLEGALGRSEAPPVERRQKVRALGRK